VLIATDLPEPVVPAISRWGILASEEITGSPPISLPSASGRRMVLSPKSRVASNSRKTTISRLSLGSSIPITLRPGTVLTRAESALIERAISSASPITRRGLQARCGFQFIHRYHGAGPDRDDLALHAVIVEHVFQHARVFLERLVARGGGAGYLPDW
jgi:hypothetical protein